ncbi:MAG: phosphatase PAP2 family protein [Deltaproteobacteria bacterium]|nr:phosphatase PAP2 family protein [Deltaproteobacteria bacterium]
MRLYRHLLRLVYSLGLDLAFLCLFGAIFLAVRAHYGGHLTLRHGTTLVSGTAFVVMCLVSLIMKRSMRPALQMVRDWVPLLLILLIYSNFHDLTYLIRPSTVDDSLRAWDVRLFRVEPTLWLQPYVRPWLTEYMTFCYALFFVFPTIVLVRLYLRGDFVLFREVGVALSLGFYLGLVGYALVPAIGPRYAFPQEFAVPLQGYWLTDRAAVAWSALQKVQRDCFPSLHTAITAIALVYLVRFRARWRWGGVLLAICTPLIVSLWASTIYLRYHYAVDVVAGFALAALCTLLAPALCRFHYDKARPWVVAAQVEAPLPSPAASIAER